MDEVVKGEMYRPFSYSATKSDTDTAISGTPLTLTIALADSTGPRAWETVVEVGLVAPTSDSSASEVDSGGNLAGATIVT